MSTRKTSLYPKAGAAYGFLELTWALAPARFRFDLVEVVPPFRLTHKFPPLSTVHQLTPSAYDAPVSPLTIAFTYVDGAADINGFDPLLYFEAVELHNHCLRLTLAEFQGYEIREQDGQVRVVALVDVFRQGVQELRCGKWLRERAL